MIEINKTDNTLTGEMIKSEKELKADFHNSPWYIVLGNLIKHISYWRLAVSQLLKNVSHIVRLQKIVT